MRVDRLLLFMRIEQNRNAMRRFARWSHASSTACQTGVKPVSNRFFRKTGTVDRYYAIYVAFLLKCQTVKRKPSPIPRYLGKHISTYYLEHIGTYR